LVSNPRILLLESSHQPGFVALAEGEKLLCVRQLDEARRHARDLAPATSELLASQRWQPHSINVVVVGRGPGSYTGLRVGIMSAKALAYATKCDVLGIETFAVIAAQAPADVGRLAVVADAQQDKIYVQEFELGSPVSALRIERLGDWLEAVNEPLCVTGPGLRKWASKLPGTIRQLDSALWLPGPESLLKIGWARYKRGERDDMLTLVPIYLRPSAAEEQWKGK